MPHLFKKKDLKEYIFLTHSYPEKILKKIKEYNKLKCVTEKSLPNVPLILNHVHI